MATPKLKRTRLALASLCVLGGSALAQTSPWYVGAGLSVTREHNLYRLADDAATPAGVARSDLITSATLLAGLDQPIGRQRLYADATLRTSRFQDNTVLDNDGYSLRTGLDWSTAGRLSGNLDLRSDRSLARFTTDTEIGPLTRQNIETASRLAASVRVGVVTEYTAEAGLEYRQVSYSAAEFDARENRVATATAGLRWRPRAGFSLGGGLRLARGEFPQFQALPEGGFAEDRYDRQGIDVFFGLSPSGASRWDARVTFGRTRYEESPQRDFSGATGNLSWTWQPGGRFQLVTRLSREDGQDSSFSDSRLIEGIVDYSRTTTTLSLRANYELSAKIRLVGGLSVGEREVVRTLPPNPLVPINARGRDNLAEVSLGLSWEPTRSLVFGCDAGYETRSVSGELSRPYSASRFGCYGQVFLR